jgi:hypothetical protein
MRLLEYSCVLLFFNSNLSFAKVHKLALTLEISNSQKDKFVIQNGIEGIGAAANADDSRLHLEQFFISIDSKNISSLYSCLELKELQMQIENEIPSVPMKLIDESVSGKVNNFPISMVVKKEIQSRESVSELIVVDLFSLFTYAFLSLVFCQVFLILVYIAAIKLKMFISRNEMKSTRYVETLRNQPDSLHECKNGLNATCSEESIIDDVIHEVDISYLIAMAAIKEKLASDLIFTPVHHQSSTSNPPLIQVSSTVDDIVIIDLSPLIVAIPDTSNESYYQNECVNLKKQVQSIQNYLKEYKAEVNAQQVCSLLMPYWRSFCVLSRTCRQISLYETLSHCNTLSKHHHHQERDYITRTRGNEASKVVIADLKSVTKELSQSKEHILILESHCEVLKKELDETKSCKTKEDMNDIGDITSSDKDETVHYEVEALYKTHFYFPEDNDFRSFSPFIPKEIASKSPLFTPRSTCSSSLDSPRMNVYSQHLQTIKESQVTPSKLPRPAKRPFKRMDSPRSVTDSWIVPPLSVRTGCLV